MEWKEPINFKEIDGEGYILTKRYFHKFFGELKAIPNSHIEGEYEIIQVYKETDDAYYGMPLEGMGLANCMCLKEDCRPFTENEQKYWKRNHVFGMYGSNSGNLSFTYNVGGLKDLLGEK